MKVNQRDDVTSTTKDPVAECETRYLNERRCPDCQLFASRIGPGGTCPHCDEPVAAIVLATACRWLIVSPMIGAYRQSAFQPGRRALRAHS